VSPNDKPLTSHSPRLEWLVGELQRQLASPGAAVAGMKAAKWFFVIEENGRKVSKRYEAKDLHAAGKRP
jgi:hypothetical protein